MCGCFNLNGRPAVFFAQFLLFFGMMFSWTVLIDCSFVTVDTELTLGEDFAGLPFTVATNLGLGTFMKPDGQCYFYDLGASPEDQLDWYVRTLTPEWNVGRGFAAAGALGGIAAFFYSLSFSCSSHLRGFRYFTVLVSSVVLPLSQSLSLLTFNSDFCTENECDFSRSSILCLVSACCYFEAGLAFIVMSDYPGQELLAKERRILARQKVDNEQIQVVSIDDELDVPLAYEDVIQAKDKSAGNVAVQAENTAAIVAVQTEEEIDSLHVFEDNEVGQSDSDVGSSPTIHFYRSDGESANGAEGNVDDEVTPTGNVQASSEAITRSK
jgi:hypothetical protein